MDSAHRLGQAALIALAIFCALTIDIMGVGRSVVLDGRYVGDFTVFWTAARVDPPIIYDVEAISHAQAPLIGGDMGPRPFVNPPSFLPWLEPFSRLDFFVAMGLWSVLGLGALALASRRLLEWRHVPLILIAPQFLLGVLAGQVSFFMAAAMITAVIQLGPRPILAGALLGLAATIKPQAVLLAPLALLAGGHWRALLSAIVTGATIGLICVIVQGPQLWLDWLGAVEGFVDISQYYYLMRRGATPTNLVYQLGLSGGLAAFVIWSLRAFGVLLVIAAFRGPPDNLNRIAALAAGNILCLPYAMPYEAVPLLIPAAVWLLGRDKLLWFPGFLMISQLQLPLAVIAVGLAAFWRSAAAAPLLRRLTPAPKEA